jgi:hypothetical protein
MALVPRIDLSCPLGVDEQRRIAGHCNHCDTPVHALDGMDESARRALLASAQGPVCVSYRVPARLAQVAAIALTLVATTSFAGERDVAAAPQSQVQGTASPAPQTGKQERIKPLGTLIVLGAVADPRDADWVDDSTLPDLPVISMDAQAQEDAVAQPRAALVTSGAY